MLARSTLMVEHEYVGAVHKEGWQANEGKRMETNEWGQANDSVRIRFVNAFLCYN